MIMIAIRAARSPCRIVCLARTCYTVYNVQCKLQLDICAARSKITGLYPMTRAEARDSVELDRYGNSEVNMGGGVILPITAWSSRVQVTHYHHMQRLASTRGLFPVPPAPLGGPADPLKRMCRSRRRASATKRARLTRDPSRLERQRACLSPPASG